MVKFLMIIALGIALAVIADCKVEPQNDDGKCVIEDNPFSGFLQWLSEETSAPSVGKVVSFDLYSREMRNKFEWNGKGMSTGFKPERKTVFIVHGFKQHGDKWWIKDMIDAYLELDDVNIIVVDWKCYSDVVLFQYYKAVAKCKVTSSEITKFIMRVVETYPQAQTWGNIHMIGHSLGAHVSGMTGRQLISLKSKWRVARITGLDPAEPCFASTGLALNKNDAPFVDVVHSNGGTLGLMNAIGHMDFYPNGGQRQPGCFYSGIFPAICNHIRAFQYFIESLQLVAQKSKKKFWGHKWNFSRNQAISLLGRACNSNECVEMGINADKYERKGIFFVTTASAAPYVDPGLLDLVAIKLIM
ncbi:pancreatic triacylglycerol lipase-like [Fopius arisanus]|uniref:phospholipase A1 n=1 Tax=Fopius arisanus TaxID=64838 RepID=A0A9R1TM48_9HYME|nr:PREDICTED: pancreatic triacylglycerol lipase-like [Fopius arisanus]